MSDQDMNLKFEIAKIAGAYVLSDALITQIIATCRREMQPPASADRDAYEGAREDLLDWKRRALVAEGDLRNEVEANRRLVEALNEMNGPTHMGEPVLAKPPATPPADIKQTDEKGRPMTYWGGLEATPAEVCGADRRTGGSDGD